jgi:beta-ribofuranosylaminobenzene 5'-phosphate synthase
MPAAVIKKGPSYVRPFPATSAAIRVTAPARLHLGFLDLNGELGRRYGSIGLSIDRPSTELTLAKADRHSATGPESQRAVALLRKFVGESHDNAYAITVSEAIPAHAGLGSGTQLALAVGSAVARIEGRELSAADLAALGDRGARSGIGLEAFRSGGFIIDGGKGKEDRPPPVTLRSDFPVEWRVMLILDPRNAGVSGEAETTAFAGLPPFPEASAAHICHLVLMKLVPGLKEEDLGAFGSALTEIQEIVGGHFAAKQGGSAWTSKAVGQLAARMRELGATGIGQSSWGPTGFAFVESQKAAERLYHSLNEDAKRVGLEIHIARGRNSGATIETLRNSQRTEH